MKKASRRPPLGGFTKKPTISVLVQEPRWREDKSVLRLIRSAAGLVLAAKAPVELPRRAKSRPPAPAVTILLTHDARVKALNASFRGKDRPTNVLSFPAVGGPSYLGDIAIAYGVVSREARAQRKDFAAHAAHLAVHGVLHLLGLNHENMREARAMETVETEILARLGICDPYAPRPLRLVPIRDPGRRPKVSHACRF
jgi:probable rRNA maturation factor